VIIVAPNVKEDSKMINGSPVNADPNQCVVANTNEMAWSPTEYRGVSKKVLERVIDPRKGRETALFKLEPGASLPAETLTERVQIFVVEGSYSDGHGTYTKHTWVWNPPGHTQTISSSEGCVFYAKRRVPIYSDESTRARQIIDSKAVQWLEFPHRGADVLHLYKDPNGLETGRIGHVHTNRKLPSHDHSIGEETFVLEGQLSDEYTAYPAGFWFRMPCGVPHAPFTGDARCKMLIREGDLVW
jgi:anti-sigma factor ChrR (cupin superfamily)